MISANIASLRKKKGLSQEALADKIGVSRQTIAKWESGESAPDVVHCDAMADLFDVTLDALVHENMEMGPPPQGRYIFGTVTVGEKGQIVIPVKARRVFNIKPGDDLMVLGADNQGLALMRADFFLEAAKVWNATHNTQEET
jgi:AbrB family looped-hinge helix DNA binding protein